MTFVPSMEYLEKRDFNLTTNKYFERDSLFDGKVLYHDLSSKFVNGWEYENGKITHYEYPIKEQGTSTTRSATGEITCYERWIVTVTIYYYIVNGGAPQYNFIEYKHSSETLFCVYSSTSRFNREVSWISDSDGSEGEDSGGGYKPDPDETEEIIIDDSFKDTKAECVYDKLMNLSGGFKKAIQKFDGKFPVSHLKFSVASLTRKTILAQTSPPQNYLVNITINKDVLSESPTLMVAYLFIHETVHAEMYRKILSILDNGGNLDGLTKAQWEQKLINGDYPGIYDYFTRYGVDNMQHEQIAAHYINTMANLLKDFDGGQNSMQYYQDIAWQGLMGTSSYNKLELPTYLRQKVKQHF